jgi:anti-sigma B factor antagonist
MSLDRSTVGDVHVLTPKKNLLGGQETQALLAAVDEVAGKGDPRIVVDLGKISYLNSVGLGSLVKANTSCINRQGWLRIARVGTKIKNLFIVTKLTFVFDTYDSVEEAVAGANKNGS